MAKFIGKNLRKKVVRPIKNSVKNKKVSNTTTVVYENDVKNEVVTSEKLQKKENKKQKKNKEMINENKLSQMEAIVSADMPKSNVKVEKADKGLYERTENSTILLTEDNKMLLID